MLGAACEDARAVTSALELTAAMTFSLTTSTTVQSLASSDKCVLDSRKLKNDNSFDRQQDICWRSAPACYVFGYRRASCYPRLHTINNEPAALEAHYNAYR